MRVGITSRLTVLAALITVLAPTMIAPVAAAPPDRGSIAGTVFDDVAPLGTLDSGDAGLAGVDLVLIDSAGQAAGTTTTGSDGGYLFSKLPADAYEVDVVESTLPAGYLLTTLEEPLPVVVGTNAKVTDADIGYAPPVATTGQISVFVWDGQNDNTVLDPFIGFVVEQLRLRSGGGETIDFDRFGLSGPSQQGLELASYIASIDLIGLTRDSMLLQEDSFGSFADWDTLTQGMTDAEIAFWVELGHEAAQERFFGQQAALAGAGMDIGIAINAGIGKSYNGMSGVFDDATNTLDELAEFSGTLRDAARGKGNFGIGSATKADANLMGEAWVGPNYTIASDGRTLVSFDGLRQYRPPAYKPQLGTFQANLEQRLVPSGAWQSNAHLDITDLSVSQAP